MTDNESIAVAFRSIAEWIHATNKRILLLETERSGAAQRCPPSTTGSDSAAPSVLDAMRARSGTDQPEPSNVKAEYGHGVDNSVVQLPVSDLLALVQNWKSSIKTAERLEKEAVNEGRMGDATHWNSLQSGFAQCVSSLEYHIAKSAPSAAGASGGS